MNLLNLTKRWRVVIMTEQSESSQSRQKLEERMLREDHKVRLGQRMAGLVATLTSAEQAARWAERDTAAYHEVIHGDRGKKEAEELEMAEVRLGDEIHNYQPQPQSKSLSPILAAALGAALPGVGAAGYFANQILNPADPPPIVEGVDTTVRLGLGKIEDFLPDQPAQ